MPEKICPLCKQPKDSGESGSITQWVSVCRCDMDSAAQQKLSIQICRACGKRINQGRAGSITQFIFRYDICNCDAPALVKQALESAQGEKQPEPEFIEEEEELELEAGSFPTDRYKPLALLGIGAVGSVYLASDRLLNKKVAVKILRTFSDSHLVSFQEEAKATSKLEHSGIVQLLDFGLTETDTPYMVLEYVPGMSLHEIVKDNGPLPWREAINIFRKICQALAYAHGNGILHRDIQPGNILITDDSGDSVKPKLIDFGLAKVFQESSGDQENQSTTLAGTPLYMSPDQSFNRPYDKRSEIYSLGCVLYECLTGAPPFTAENPLALLSMHAEELPPSLSEKLKSENEDDEEEKLINKLDQLVSKCLEKDPAKRFQSMEKLDEALAELTSDNSSKVEVKAIGFQKESSSRDSTKKLKTTITALVLIAISGLTAYYVYLHKQTEKLEDKKLTLESTNLIDNIGIRDPEARKKFFAQFDPDARNLKLRVILSDKAFTHLDKCNKLISLDLSTNVITDVATGYVHSPYLKNLYIQSTSVKTLEYVSKMKTLEFLNISNTLVDNKSVRKLVPLKNLRLLNLNNTNVDDSILPTIKNFPCLEIFSALNTHISKKAKRELHNAMPACIIEDVDAVVHKNKSQLKAYREKEEWAQAEKMLRSSIKLIQDAQGKDTVAQANYLTQLADVLFESGKFKEAMATIERSIALAENYGNTYFLSYSLPTKAGYLFSKHHWRDSIKATNKCIENTIRRDGLSPDLLKFYFLKADAWYHLHNHDEAEKWFRKVIATRETLLKEKVELNDSTNIVHPAIALTSVGNILNNKKQFDEGEKFFLAAIKVWNGANKEIKKKYASHIAYNFVQLGMISAKRKDYQKAAQYQTQAINILKKFNAENVEKEIKILERYQKRIGG